MFGGFVKNFQVLNPETGAKINVCGASFAALLTSGDWFYDCVEKKFSKDIKWKIDVKKNINGTLIKTYSPGFFKKLMEENVLYDIAENRFVPAPSAPSVPTPPPAETVYKVIDLNPKNKNVINKICHMADIHIPAQLYTKRMEEYQFVFNNLYSQLKSNKPDLIVITGDLLHVKLAIEPETLVTTSIFVKNLSDIAPVIIIIGNHDFAENNLQRMDSVYAICHSMENVYVLKDTGAYKFNNIMFGYNSLYDKKIIQSNQIKPLLTDETTTIGLFHGIVIGSINCNNTINKALGLSTAAFEGYDFVMLGHIHKFQELKNKEAPLVYSGSLIQQNHGEEVPNHGYVMWDVKSKSYTFQEVFNKYVFVTLKIAHNEILDSGKIELYKDRLINLRLKIFETSEHLIEDHIEVLKKSYNINSVMYNLDDSCFDTKVISKHEDVPDDTNMHIEIENEMFAHDEQLISLNKEMKEKVSQFCKKYEYSYWYPVSLKFRNLFIYGDNKVNQIDFISGINDICSPNMTGKSSIVNILMWCLFGQISYGTSKSVDIINKRHNDGMAELVFKCDNKVYYINKDIKRSPTTGRQDITTTFSMQNEDGTKLNLNGADKKATILNKIQSIIGSFDNFVSHNLLATRLNGSIINMTPAARIKHFLYIADIDGYQLMHDQANTERKQIDQQISDKNTKIRELNAWIDGSKRTKVETDEDIDKLKQELEILLKNQIQFDPIIAGKELYDIKLLTQELHELNEKIPKDSSTPLSPSDNSLLLTLNKNKITEEEILSKLQKFSKKFPSSSTSEQRTKLDNLQHNQTKYQQDIKKIDDSIIKISKPLYDINLISTELSELKSKIPPHKHNKVTIIEQNKLKILTKTFSIPINIKEIEEQISILSQKILTTPKDLTQLNSLLSKISSKLYDITTKIAKLKDLPREKSDSTVLKDDLDAKFESVQAYKKYSNFEPNSNLDKLITDLHSHTEYTQSILTEMNQIESIINTKLPITPTDEIKTYSEIIDLRSNLKPLFHVEIKPMEDISDLVSGDDKEFTLIAEFKSCKKMGQSVLIPYELYEKICKIIDDTAILSEKQAKRDKLNAILKDQKDQKIIVEKNKQITEENNLLQLKINNLAIARRQFLKIVQYLYDKNHYSSYINFHKEYVKMLHNYNYQEYESATIQHQNLSTEKNEIEIQIKLAKEDIENATSLTNLKKIREDYSQFLDISQRIQTEKDLERIDWLNEYIKDYEQIKKNIELTENKQKLQFKLNEINYDIKIQLNILEEFIENDNNILLHHDIQIRDALNNRVTFQKISQRINWINEYIANHELIKLNKQLEKTSIQNSDRINVINFTLTKHNKFQSDMKEKTDELTQLKNQIQSLVERSSILVKYTDLVHHDKIPLKILNKYISIFNNNVNKIFKQYTKYDFECIYEDNKLLMTIGTKDNLILDAERLSGYESIILQLAINNGIISISKVPKCGILVIDESFDCIDKDRFVEKLPDILEIIKRQYHSVLLISHRDVPHHLLDKKIKISFNGETSLIV